MKNCQLVKSAWLVTWEWSGAYAGVKSDKNVAAVLNSRFQGETIRVLVEQLYAALEYRLWDKVAAARTPADNPYPAEFGEVNGVRWTGEVFCGHNPQLYARKVKNLIVTIDYDGKQQSSWDEIPRPKGPKT